MAKKKEIIERALKMYEKKLQYNKEYQKKHYEKVTLAIRKEDLEKLMQKGYSKDTAKKILAYKKLKEELQKKEVF